MVKEQKQRKKQPLLARILAGVIVGGLLLWGVVSCGASLAQGARYSHCMEQARAAGQPDDEFTQKQCMLESQ